MTDRSAPITPAELATLRVLARKVAATARGPILALVSEDETTVTLRALAGRLPARKDN